jgi:SSS family solute:Na+ symporter/sodium/pantothenate symporter
VPTSAGLGAFAALIAFLLASLVIGAIAQRMVEGRSFLKGYFLGNRGLGSWTVALTATVQSGGTFMGFPSLVYSHGWVVALWIAGYMVVPLTGFAVLGKRISQISRRTGAITVPDLLRERFQSPGLGLVSSLLIIFFMSAMMIAQFKAGALIMKVAWPGSGALALTEDDPSGGLDRYYYIGLVVFASTVIAYSVMGGFLAAVWTDLFQSLLMWVGVVMLLPLCLSAVGDLRHPAETLEKATRQSVERLAELQKAAPAAKPTEKPRTPTPPVQYAYGPGYAADGRSFHPLGLAFSFFFVWVFAGMGSPATLVRLMACRDSATLRRSVFLLNSYNFCIYIPLVIICICGRALIPHLPPARSDEIIPRLTIATTAPLPGGSLLAGLILSAPFGAVMSTVSSYLVVIASGLVRDVYQRFLRRDANDTELRRVSYIVMTAVGVLAVLANLKPPRYLQAVVVFSGTGSAATFLAVATMAAFWRRATAAGAFAAMLAGFATMLGLYATGWLDPADPMIGQATRFRPYYLLGLDPIVWGLAASFASGIVVSMMT